MTLISLAPPAQCQPPDREVLTRVLCAMRGWQPYDGGALLDAVADALDLVTPRQGDVEGIARQLHHHLAQLVTIAAATGAEQRDPQVASLTERARVLRCEEIPVGRQAAVRHLRQLAWTVNELLERLVATRRLKAAA